MMDYLKLFLGGLAFISLILVLIAIYARINDAQADEPMRDENPIDIGGHPRHPQQIRGLK